MVSISESTLEFLTKLKENNNREWFTANKPVYERAKKEFTEFVDNLILRIAEFDPSIAHNTGKGTIFRIYRDVRFSIDKSPYKTHFGAYISAASRISEIHSGAGYYIHIEPSGESMLAGGAYMPDGSWLKGIREEIHYNPEEFKSIIGARPFVEYFGPIEGEKLKRVPKGYQADHPEIELLKHKSFLAVHKCPDAMVVSEEFQHHSTAVFRALQPFNQFLNEAAE